LSRAASYSQLSGPCYYADPPPSTHVVYALFLALRELHAVTIDPLPPSTPPARDAVPNHPRTSLSSTHFESAVSAVSTNVSPSGRSHTTTTSPLVPATRLRSDLEGENRTDALPHPPEIRPYTASERARKRQRLEIINPSSQIASSSRLGSSTAEYNHLPKDTLSMRPPEREYESNPTSPHIRPRTRSPSLSPSPKVNGHVANGHGSPMNGSTKRSRSPVARVELPGATIYDDSYIDREEYIRLVIQSLRDIGYIESAATLEAESGYVMETSRVAEFRRCILEGTWSEAESALEHLGVAENDGLWEAKFFISQQKYLEYLESGKTAMALHVLRNELAPLHTDPDLLHPLSSLVMCTDAADLRQKAGWDGAHGSSRRRLLVNVQSYIPSSLMIPPRRFVTLLDQARLHQISQCIYHNAPITPQHFSLYADHTCDTDLFPRITTTILQVHTDEVWSLEWSHSGKFLASASKDKSVIVWSVGPNTNPDISLHLHLQDHQFPVGCLAWSLDDTILLSSCEQLIKMWNTESGALIRTIEAHTEPVSALAWVPDGSGFISASQDRKINLWGSDGKQRDSWGITATRIIDLAVTPDFTRLVAIGESAKDPILPTPRSDAAASSTANRNGNNNAAPNGPRTLEYLMIVYDLTTKQPEL